VDDLWASKSEDVGLIVRTISFQDFQHMVMIHQRHRRTDGQTDRQTTSDSKTTLCTIVHRAVKTKSKSDNSSPTGVLAFHNYSSCYMVPIIPVSHFQSPHVTQDRQTDRRDDRYKRHLRPAEYDGLSLSPIVRAGDRS